MTTNPPAPTSAVDTVVLIHGLWMTPLSWEHWNERFTNYGFTVIAPAWPGISGTPEELRADPKKVPDIGISEILDHYEGIIRGLDKPPIIMGHSFGGLFTQVLLDRGLGAAGVGVDAAQTKGVLKLPFSTIKASFGVLGNPLNHNKSVPFSAKQFHYAFCNTLTADESQVVYDRYAIPAVGRVLFEGGLANFNPKAATKVDYGNNDRAPLLFLAGGMDHVVPASVNKINAKKYEKSSAITELKEYPDRTHNTVGQLGWEDVADYALGWAVEHAKTLAAS
jgi:alpha-beta hydrolase superfamily lysophospholipase